MSREERGAVLGIQPSATAQSSTVDREGNDKMSAHNIVLKLGAGEEVNSDHLRPATNDRIFLAQR